MDDDLNYQQIAETTPDAIISINSSITSDDYAQPSKAVKGSHKAYVDQQLARAFYQASPLSIDHVIDDLLPMI